MSIEEFKNDWRNMGQLDYLFRKKLEKVRFKKDLGDHEHCEFCSEKISYLPNCTSEGYCTVDTDFCYWICHECYEDFKEVFQWLLV